MQNFVIKFLKFYYSHENLFFFLISLGFSRKYPFLTHNELACVLKTHKTFFDAKSGLTFHLNTAPFFNFLSFCLKSDQ
ncbi:hypothetical protein BB433_07075 [Helicobacter pylori]|nr:hypothetical protein BB433_07075 [Helicobacter pylori]